MNLEYHSSNIILATYEQENKIKTISYSPCNCKEKYQFKEHSRLLPYLQKCKGWVNDEQGYTLNYVLIVFIAFLVEQKLIYYDKSLHKHMIRLNSDLRIIFIGINHLKPWCSILQAKLSIARYHLKNYRKISTSDKISYFKCPRGSENLITSIIGDEGIYEQYFHYSSQCIGFENKK